MNVFKVAKSPSDELSVTNKIFFHPSQWNANQDKYVVIQSSGKKFIFKAGTDERITKGTISSGGLQRKWMYCGIGECVQCNPYQFSTTVMVTEIMVELDLFTKTTNLKDPIDSDKLAMKFLERFYDSPVTINQLILFNAENINFEVTIKQINGFNIKDSSACNEIEVGVMQSNTVLKFQRKPEAKFILSGRSKTDTASINILNPNWDFNSIGVGGLDEEFSQIFRRAFLSRLLPTEYVSKLGLKHLRGILLYGPPGTGKTLTARQIGKMLNAREPKIVNGPSILDKYVGESEANIRKLFADAEEEFKRLGNQSALHIIIFDEIDAICKARGSLSGGSAVQDTVVNQLLSKMDGVEQLNNILVIGMTNRRDMIDEALLRPGRMGVQIEVPLPSEAGRLQIFQIHTKNLREQNVLADDVDLPELASLTKNFSGAEIEGLVMAALSNAQIEKFDPKKGMAIRMEDLESFRISRSHFMYSLKHDVKPFFGKYENELQEFLENPMIKWGSPFSEILQEADLIIRGIRDEDIINKNTLLLHGSSHTGKTALAVHLAQQTGFTFIRMCSIRNMIGFSENGRCMAIKKIFDDALKAPNSVIILDDLEHLVDYSSIGPRFSINLVKNLIGMIACNVPKNKKMLIIGTTTHLTAMKELEIFFAFGKNALKVPEITHASEIVSVLAEQQDLFREGDLERLEKELKMDLSTNLSIGIKQLVKECKVLKSVNPEMRINKLIMKLKASGDDNDLF